MVAIRFNDDLKKPYKGPQSYQSHDAGLFYGRDTDSENLLSKILSSPFSLLHAQSGAGKTSLLNARIIPLLETRGWLPVRILPQNNPIDSTWYSALQALFPPLESEAFATQRALTRLAGGDEDLSLDDLLDRYDRLSQGSPEKRELIAPINQKEIVGNRYEHWLGDGQITPYFCRLLRATMELKDLNEHFKLFLPNPHNQPFPLTGNSTVRQFEQFCSDSHSIQGYQDLLGRLEAQNPLWGLLEKFENLYNVLDEYKFAPKIALIFDQFEELFTRFVDPGQFLSPSVDNPDWRLRWRLFDELQALYYRGYGDAPSNLEGSCQTKSVLPIKYVISMRSEWISRLDSITRFAPDIVATGYHLDLLVKETARQAIQEPAKQFGFGYENTLYDRIINDLSKELRFIEPTHLQIVCEKLWFERGRELTKENQGANSFSEPNHSDVVELAVYEKLDGAAGILKSYLLDFLENLEPKEKLIATEILESLVTISGTRNIVDYVQLINSPFRNASATPQNHEANDYLNWNRDFIHRRQECLAKLVNRNIIRMESRLGGQFVEITHEFLIEPICKQVSKDLYRNKSYKDFRQALLSLIRCEDKGLCVDMDQEFEKGDFFALNAYVNDIQWSHWSCEFMLRQAIEYDCGKDFIAGWLQRYTSLPEIKDPWKKLESQLYKFDQENQYDICLGYRQIQLINSKKHRLSHPSAGILRIILRSFIKHGRDSDRADIAYWSRKFYEQQPH